MINDVLKKYDNALMMQEHEGYEWNQEGRRWRRHGSQNDFREEFQELEARVVIES